MKSPAVMILMAVTVTLLLSFHSSKHEIENKRNIVFKNGWIFTGEKFEKKNLYSIGGVLSFKKPRGIDSIVDVSNKYIVPPFGEAHNHNLGDERNLDKQISMYLSQGVFYAKNLHYLPERTKKISGKVNVQESVDVLYAHTGLAASGGHVHSLYKNLFNRKVLPEFSSIDELDTKAYILIDSDDDLEIKWPTLMAMNPGIVKVYLEYSEDYELRKNNPDYGDERGISPELLKKIVVKAHRNQLRVSAHIESAGDFRNAVGAGVDEIAHLPGFRVSKFKTIDDYRLSLKDVLEAKEKGVHVITTTALANSFNKNDPEILKAIKELQIENLKLLKNNKVKIVFGSDLLNSTSLEEALYVYQLGVFSNLELIKILCEDTPANVFPNRKIGMLKEGYEASFLILNENPLERFDAIKGIASRFKQGAFLNIE